MIYHCYNCMNLIVTIEISGRNNVEERSERPFFAICCKKGESFRFPGGRPRTLSSLIQEQCQKEQCVNFDVHNEDLTRADLVEELDSLPESKFESWLGTNAEEIYNGKRKDR